MFGGRAEGEEHDAEEASDSEDYAEGGGHADCFEGAVGDAETDKIPVRAALQQDITVIGNCCQVMCRC